MIEVKDHRAIALHENINGAACEIHVSPRSERLHHLCLAVLVHKLVQLPHLV